MKESKLGQALRHLPSADTNANRVWLTAALLAVNLAAWCCDLCPAAGASGKAPKHAPLRRAAKTLRNLIFNIPARIVRTGRRLILRPPAGYRHADTLRDTLQAIYASDPDRRFAPSDVEHQQHPSQLTLPTPPPLTAPIAARHANEPPAPGLTVTLTPPCGFQAAADGLPTDRGQRPLRVLRRVRPSAFRADAHSSVSDRSQSFTRPWPRSRTGRGMSAYRRWYWLTVLR
ncbi:MAG: hypothetical protein ACRDNS_13460 [Trebonia sp.]